MVAGADRRRLRKGLAIGFMNKSLVLKLHARAPRARKNRKDTSWSQ